MTAEWESESGTEAAECFAAFGIVQPEEAGGEDACCRMSFERGKTEVLLAVCFEIGTHGEECPACFPYGCCTAPLAGEEELQRGKGV